MSPIGSDIRVLGPQLQALFGESSRSFWRWILAEGRPSLKASSASF